MALQFLSAETLQVFRPFFMPNGVKLAKSPKLWRRWVKATKPGLRRHWAAILTMRWTRRMRCPCRMAWRMSCLREVHLIRDTRGEIAYHACISVAFIVETITIACRVAAQPARRTRTAAAVSSPAGASYAGNRSTDDRSQPDDSRPRGGEGRPDAGRGSAGAARGDRQRCVVLTVAVVEGILSLPERQKRTETMQTHVSPTRRVTSGR